MGKISAIVLAGGSGSRMQSQIKKQFMELNGKPLIFYALNTFCNSSVDEVILVTGREDIEYCKKEIVERYSLDKVKAVVEGGSERYWSVYAGLKAVGEADIVLIHDGARPFVTSDIIDTSIEATRKHRACVAAMPVKDTIKLADENRVVTETPDRRKLWMMQTPQSFDYSLIMECYEKIIEDRVENITDDAMIVEYGSDVKIHLVEGSYKNIKVTTPEDMIIAEAFLQRK